VKLAVGVDRRRPGASRCTADRGADGFGGRKPIEYSIPAVVHSSIRSWEAPAVSARIRIGLARHASGNCANAHPSTRRWSAASCAAALPGRSNPARACRCCPGRPAAGGNRTRPCSAGRSRHCRCAPRLVSRPGRSPHDRSCGRPTREAGSSLPVSSPRTAQARSRAAACARRYRPAPAHQCRRVPATPSPSRRPVYAAGPDPTRCDLPGIVTPTPGPQARQRGRERAGQPAAVSHLPQQREACVRHDTRAIPP
jgi:hypothetical protein